MCILALCTPRNADGSNSRRRSSSNEAPKGQGKAPLSLSLPPSSWLAALGVVEEDELDGERQGRLRGAVFFVLME